MLAGERINTEARSTLTSAMQHDPAFGASGKKELASRHKVDNLCFVATCCILMARDFEKNDERYPIPAGVSIGRAIRLRA